VLKPHDSVYSVGGDDDDSESNASLNVTLGNAVESILNYSVDVVFGIDAEPGDWARPVVNNFISDLTAVWRLQDRSDCGSPAIATLTDDTTSPRLAIAPSESGGGSNDRAKRRSPSGGGSQRNNENSGHDHRDDQRDGNRQPKRLKTSETHKQKQGSGPYMCPFRMRDPSHFGIRTHRCCATTRFADLAEVR
jgi:hypothetical protein